MQETHYSNGKVIREFFQLEEANGMAKNYQAAIANPEVTEVRQAINIQDDHPCPCRSGMKFARCCKGKVNMGPEVIKGR